MWLQNRAFKLAILCVALVSIFFLLLKIPLEKPLIKTAYSTVLLDKEGQLLGAQIAQDEQWRFKAHETLNPKYKAALLYFEDRHFYEHYGVSFSAIARAVVQNIKAGHVVSGGSTITMQLSRIVEGHQSRTFLQKLKEVVLALRIEAQYSKDEILELYANHAPFGGNTVGVSTATWRYFGRTSRQMSWAEAALLAILPNAPSMFHLSRSREALKLKRDRLLKRLFKAKIITKQDYELSLMESLPEKPKVMPQIAPLFMQTLKKEYPHKPLLLSTIEKGLQLQVQHEAERYSYTLAQEGIHNISIIVVENRTMALRAYVGNRAYENSLLYANALDLTRRPRSTGSTLKPLLYASALDDGYLTPNMLVSDTPSYYSGYMPTNYDERYRGVVTAKEALIKSLNVPTVRILHGYGYKRFYDALKAYGMTTLFREADAYGLALVLGGAETTLYDLSNIYANMSAIAQGRHSGDFWKLSVLEDENATVLNKSPISQGAAFLTLDVIKNLRRFGLEGKMKNLVHQREVAWKTGTSYGLRDAWAIGTTQEYTVGVWVGNATGEGVATLSGTRSASPLMFDVFRHLGQTHGFERPEEALKEISVCKEDGFLATEACESVPVLVPMKSEFVKISPYRKWVHLDLSGNFRVNSSCEPVSNMQLKSFFVLPPKEAYYYKKYRHDYREIPPFRTGCSTMQEGKEKVIEIDYPVKGHSIYLPQKLDGSFAKVTLKAMHQKSSSRLYWHLDDKYIGETIDIHERSVFIRPGEHTLLVMDASGNSAKRQFNVLAKDGTF